MCQRTMALPVGRWGWGVRMCVLSWAIKDEWIDGLHMHGNGITQVCSCVLVYNKNVMCVYNWSFPLNLFHFVFCLATHVFCLLSSFSDHLVGWNFIFHESIVLFSYWDLAQHDLGVSTYELQIYHPWLDENQTCRNGLELYDLVIDYRVCSSMAIVLSLYSYESL